MPGDGAARAAQWDVDGGAGASAGADLALAVSSGFAGREVLVPRLSLVLAVRGASSGLARDAVVRWVRRECGDGVLVSDVRSASDDGPGLDSAEVSRSLTGARGGVNRGDPAAETWQAVGDRLTAGLVTVVDATSLSRQVLASLVELAAEHDVCAVGVVLGSDTSAVEGLLAAGCEDVTETLLPACCEAPSEADSSEVVGVSGVTGSTPDAGRLEGCRIVLQPLPCDAMGDYGPFDIVGDVHGCAAELRDLLRELGYRIVQDDQGRAVDAVPPVGRTAIFVGDVVNRGPDSVGVLRLVMGMCRSGHARAVQGNHEHQLSMVLRGQQVTLRAGLRETLAEVEEQSQEFRDEALAWCAGLPSHLVLAGGALVVVHAGLAERFHGRDSVRVTSLALYGEPIREKDEHGLPVRTLWANNYRGDATVVYGHTPTLRAEWLRGTICLDTGCVYGGRLTAVQFPEREIVSVPSRGEWFTLLRPLEPLSDLLT